MLAEAPPKESSIKSTFPLETVRRVLRKELQEAEEESALLHSGWEPVLDSLRIVTVIATLEGMFDFPIPPEKVVRKGGYTSVDQCADEIIDNLRRLWDKNHK